MKKTENNITELVFILDRSGSMAGLEDDTIGGFNSLIEKQKKEEGNCLVTTVLFDHEMLTLHDRVPLSEIEPLTRRDYEVRGSTALIDAIGTTVDHISKVQKYIRSEDVPQNTMFVIITDGHENASRIYSSDNVKSMIEQKKELGWEFLFLGANIDAVETAARFGIDRDRAVDYMPDGKGTKLVYDAVSDAVSAVGNAAPLTKAWSAKVKKDYKNRKK